MTHIIFKDAIDIVESYPEARILRTRNDWVEAEFYTKDDMEKACIQLLHRGYNLQINRGRYEITITMPV